MRIVFLIHNGYGIGGTIRTTFTLAQALAEHHEVEIVSVFRHCERPSFVLGPRVRLRHLVDLRYERDDPRHQRPARVFPRSESRYRQYSELTDERIACFLASVDADIVVGTRPGLNVHLARQTRRGVIRVGQEHLTLKTHSPRLTKAIRHAYPRLDALTCTTKADAAAYREHVRLPGVRVETLPNSVPEPGIEPADGTGRYVIAAGRLVRMKRYDLLIEAFAAVVAERPDWKLRIYGRGAERNRLRALIHDLDLSNHAFLMGAASPIEAEWVKGSIGVVTSSFESFGMTLIEAMRCGLTVVSADCPLGPPEIIQDGVDGVLVPSGDREATADALLRLISDEDLRRALGATARENAKRFDPVPVAECCERLFGDLLAARPRSGRGWLASWGRRVSATLVGGRGSTRPRSADSGQPGGERVGAAAESEPSELSGALAEVLPGPTADCAVDSQGRITVELSLAASPLPKDEESFLLLRLGLPKGGQGAAGEAGREKERLIRLALSPAGNGRWRGVLPSGDPALTEGRWDLYVGDLPGWARVRLLSGLLDLRSLLDQRPEPDTSPLAVRIPYSAKGGFLAVRTWLRAAHAEVDGVLLSEDTLTVYGRLFGARLAVGAAALLRRRGHGDGEAGSDVLEVPVRDEERKGKRGFSFTFCLGELARAGSRGREVWDLFVRPGGEGDPVRVGGLLDDVAHKERIFTFPAKEVGDVVVRPYYTGDNDLSLEVTPQDAGA